jgi:hypothetical protein
MLTYADECGRMLTYADVGIAADTGRTRIRRLCALQRRRHCGRQDQSQALLSPHAGITPPP